MWQCLPTMFNLINELNLNLVLGLKNIPPCCCTRHYFCSIMYWYWYQKIYSKLFQFNNNLDIYNIEKQVLLDLNIWLNFKLLNTKIQKTSIIKTKFKDQFWLFFLKWINASLVNFLRIYIQFVLSTMERKVSRNMNCQFIFYDYGSLVQ